MRFKWAVDNSSGMPYKVLNNYNLWYMAISIPPNFIKVAQNTEQIVQIQDLTPNYHI